MSIIFKELTQQPQHSKMSDISDDEVEKTIADDLVVTKYKMAGDMANAILKLLLPKCTSGG